MIGAAELARMKPGSVLVNTSRGGLVDCDALLAAIEGDVLGFYAADTIRDEAGMCEAERLLAEHPRVLLTPHIGAQTERSFAKMCTVAVENMLAALASPPPP
ncbi:MAG: D-glycerate dehydrogenase, partial [Myxococcales bacterium]|nr:D-glycerate dehydrogenase [Myxococcales bacterium]